jgi:hypothetical protein
MRSCTRTSIWSRICRTSSRLLPAGSGTSQSSTMVGTYGQVAPHARVTAQSACSCISTSSRFGRWAARSIPISRIASTTSGHTPSRRGSWPADSARTSAGAWRLNSASAIWERPALWVQTNRIFFIGALLSGGEDEPLRVLDRQSGFTHLGRDRLGAV